jgi:hypothetical protein
LGDSIVALYDIEGRWNGTPTQVFLKVGFGVLAVGRADRQHPKCSLFRRLRRESNGLIAGLSDFEKALHPHLRAFSKSRFYVIARAGAFPARSNLPANEGIASSGKPPSSQ